MNTVRFFSLSLLACFFSCFAFSQGGAGVDKFLTYKTLGETELKLHAFFPKEHKATDQRPAVIFFFGGGWVGGSPKQFYGQCEYLASRGLVAFSAEYRVKSRHGTTPKECVKDAKSAIRWVREQASALGIDPEKIIAGGGSAGGHIAAATGTTKAFEEEGENLAISSRPCALVLFNPVFDNGPQGYGHSRVKGYWKDISPAHNISDLTPPTIVFLGTKDKIIPVGVAKNFKGLMEKKGRRCDLHLYEDQPHGFFNRSKSQKHYDQTLMEMDRFLVSLGYLEKKAKE